MRSFGKQK